MKLFVKMRFEPQALLPSDRHCRSVLEGLCREKWGKWLCLDPIGEGSEAPLSFLLFPVGGAAAVLREGGVPVGQRAEDSVWEKLEPGRLPKQQVQRGRCKEESMDKGQGRADSKKAGSSSPRGLGEREEAERSSGFARG